jgi:hypothetical protein
MTYRKVVAERHEADEAAPEGFLMFENEDLSDPSVRWRSVVEDVVGSLRAFSSYFELPKMSFRGSTSLPEGTYGAADVRRKAVMLNEKALKELSPKAASGLFGVGLHEIGHCQISKVETLTNTEKVFGPMAAEALQYFEDERVEQYIRELDPDYGSYFVSVREGGKHYYEPSEGATPTELLTRAAGSYLRNPAVFNEHYEDFEYEGHRVAEDLDLLIPPPSSDEAVVVDSAVKLAKYLEELLGERKDNEETPKEEKQQIEDFLGSPDLPGNSDDLLESLVKIAAAGGYEVAEEKDDKDEKIVVVPELSPVDGDRVDGVKSFVAADETKYNEKEFVRDELLDAHYSAVKGQVARLRKQLSLRFNDEDVVEKELLEGKLDGRSLARAKYDHHVFEQKNTKKAVGFHVCLALDESGSMWGSPKSFTSTVHHKIDAARELGIFIAASLVGIPNTTLNVFSFSTLGDYAVKDPAYPTHSDSYIKHLYSGHRVSPKKIHKYFRRFAGGGNNYDHVAVDYGTKLLEQKEGFRVLVMLNDGAPAGERYGGESACQKVRNYVEKAQRQGIYVVQVAIQSFKTPVKMYDHVVSFTDNTTLCKDFGAMIRKLAKKARYDG